jgi:uncharacterized protein (DUF2062 family)
MTIDERALKKLRGERIRRVKRWLRPLPRRANIHRYPGLKWFAESARKRAYIWSFRLQHLVPAIYAGCILAFLPLFGIQLPLALLLAILLRANLPVLAGLQFISNPVTILPIYFSAYQIGRIFLSIFGIEVAFLGRRRFEAILISLREGQWGENFVTVAQVFGVTTLGGAIVGLTIAAAAVVALKFILKRAESSYEILARRIHKHKESADQESDPKNPD